MSRYGLGMCASALLIAVVNIVELSRHVKECPDFYGFPFAFFTQGGFLTGPDGIVWRGVAADLVAIVILAAGISWALHWPSLKRSGLNQGQMGL